MTLMQATLAAIVVVALKGLYLQVRDIYKYYVLSWADMVSVLYNIDIVQSKYIVDCYLVIKVFIGKLLAPGQV